LSSKLWEPRRVIENRFRETLYNLVDFFVDNLSGEDLGKPEKVMELFQKWANSDTFYMYALEMSKRMVTGLAADNMKTWKVAARKSMKGQRIYESLKYEMRGPVGDVVRQLVSQNAQLISTFPNRISDQVARYIYRATVRGERPESTTEALIKKFPSITRGRLNLIARTETSKAQSAIVQARAKEVDLNWYIWETSQDARVRFSHRKMQGVLVCYDDPPNPEKLFPDRGVSSYDSYHAGCTYN
jgi:SPP1 gp7 family putative phage head morphogenesis protein